MVKVAYDRELSISERKVKPGDIIHNASLILGKQIVHILPEGSVIVYPNEVDILLIALDLPFLTRNESRFALTPKGAQ